MIIDQIRYIIYLLVKIRWHSNLNLVIADIHNSCVQMPIIKFRAILYILYTLILFLTVHCKQAENINQQYYYKGSTLEAASFIVYDTSGCSSRRARLCHWLECIRTMRMALVKSHRIPIVKLLRLQGQAGATRKGHLNYLPALTYSET